MDLKLKISVLWLFLGIATIRCAHWMEKGVVEKVLAGEWQVGAAESFFFTLLWWIPLVMAFLTLTLKESTNRWVNMILGIFATIFNFYHLMTHLMEWPSIHSLLIVGSTVVASVLIVWYSRKWSKEKG